MRHYFILMRPLWREMLGSLSQGLGMGGKKKKKKQMSRGASYALYAFLIILLSSYSVLYGYGMTESLKITGNMDGLILLIAAAAPATVLLFGIMQAIPTLYHESNLETLLVLPVKPSSIIAGKMTQAYLPVLLFPFLLFWPALITHGILTARTLDFFLQTIPFMVFVTLAPFVLIIILIMFLMRYTRFARDKDRFQMVTSIFAIFLAVGFSLLINMQSTSGTVPGASLFTPQGSAPALQGALRFVPSSGFGAAMLIHAGTPYTLLNGLAAFLVNLAAFSILLLLAGKLYIPGVLGMRAAGKASRPLSGEETTLALRPRTAYRAIVSRDWKLLLRTPSFFTQTILAATLLPLMMVGVVVLSLVRLAKAGEVDMSFIFFIQSWAASGMWKESAWLLVLIISGTASFFSGTNMMSASAVSRQGSLFSYTKQIPVPVKTQILAWLTPGLSFMTAVWLILAGVLTLVLTASPLFGLVIFLVALVNAYLVQITSFYTDMIFPDLDWTNEIRAVKNTRAATVSSLGMFAYIGILVGFAFLVRFLTGGSNLITAWALFLLSGAFAGLATWLVSRRMRRFLHDLDV